MNSASDLFEINMGILLQAWSSLERPQELIHDGTPSANRQTNSSSEGGSSALGTLFYPPVDRDSPLLQEGQLEGPSASSQKIVQSKAPHRVTGVHTHSGTAGIKAVWSTANRGDPAAQSEGTSGRLQQPEQAVAGQQWDSPIRRRRPGGDSGSSLVATPAARGVFRFPSHRDARPSPVAARTLLFDAATGS
jgi:hypothetical protein